MGCVFLKKFTVILLAMLFFFLFQLFYPKKREFVTELCMRLFLLILPFFTTNFFFVMLINGPRADSGRILSQALAIHDTVTLINFTFFYFLSLLLSNIFN